MRSLLLVLVFTAACGDDGVHHLADAPPAPDAAVDAAPNTPVTLTVTLDGAPVVALDVYFQDPAGAVIAKVPTNAQGVASAIMLTGGYVTVVNPFGGQRSADDVRTFAGVKPGDQLKLHDTTGAGGISVTFTAPNDVNASSFEVYSTCGGMQYLSGGGSGSGSGTGGPSGPIYLNNCGGTSDFIVQSLDLAGQPAQSFYKSNVAVADMGTVDLSGETYSATPTVTLNWTNVPAAYSGLVFQNIVATSRGGLFDTLQATGVTTGTATFALARPTVAGGVSVVSTHPTPTNGFASQFVLDWAPAAATINIDLASTGLPEYSNTPSISPATRTVTWAAGAGVAPDLAWATLAASRTGATTTTYWDWQIAMPYNSTSFTLPLLPTGIDQYNFMASDTVDVVQLITAKVPGGYDAVRAELLSSSGPEAFAIGPTGRIQYQMVDRQVEARRTVPTPWQPKQQTRATR